MGWFRIVFYGGLGLAVLLLLIRSFCTSRVTRALFLALPMLLLCGVGLMFMAGAYSGPFAFALPYESVGQWKTVDAEGTPWDVEVSVKYLSNMIPPGMLPRVRLVARSLKGRATMTYDTGWRFGVGDARPVPGGIEVFSGDGGVRFRLENGEWKVDRKRVSRSTSLWEDRLEGVFKVGMTREAILQLVRIHRAEELPDLKVWFEGDRVTQHSMDREAALYVKYSSAGVAEMVVLRPRMRGTIDELRGEIDGKLFPLVALIQGSPELLGADPVGLIRAVNGLRAAGPERAAGALREYYRLTDPNAPKKTWFNDRKFELEPDRLFCIIRLLYEPPEAETPMPLIDEPWVRKPPPAESGCPLYPIIVERGFPWVIWTRQLGGGSPQNPMVHLDWCLRNARLRASDLEPEGSPLESMKRLLASDLWSRLFSQGDDEQRTFVHSQIIAALKSVSTFPEEGRDSDASWRQWVDDVAKLNPQWDVTSQSFLPGQK